jgi:hypothetical protein
MKKLFVGIFIVLGFAFVAPFIFSNAQAAVKKKPHVPVVVKKRRPTAECEDGTSIYTTVRKGACSAHGGVMQWFH